MPGFNEVWQYLQTHLQPGAVIPNWTALKGYLGDKMTVVHVTDNVISIKTPRAKNPVNVPRGDFERVWEIWHAYKSHRLRRYELTEVTFFSKYIISLFRWYETER